MESREKDMVGNMSVLILERNAKGSEFVQKIKRTCQSTERKSLMGCWPSSLIYTDTDTNSPAHTEQAVPSRRSRDFSFGHPVEATTLVSRHI